MDFRAEDLRLVAQIGRSLWADPTRAEPVTVETVSAVSLQELTPERALEKAARAMLERAEREGMAENTLANLSADPVLTPFFRLSPKERLVLTALHIGRWSYARAARVAGMTLPELEEAAWAVRLRLGSRRDYPVGGGPSTPNCPEYDSRRPWTQRFLDEEFESGRERIFLQNHLMACGSCRRALAHARDLYYGVDSIVPRLDGTRFIESLHDVLRQKDGVRPGADMTWARSVEIFFGRSRLNRVLLAVLSFLVVAVLVSLAR